MSCTFEKLLMDVKNLTVKLKNSDKITDRIIKDTSYVQLKLRSMNELQDYLIDLARKVNNFSNDGPLVFEGRMENSNLEKLRSENVELRQLLQEYQTALELIMTRYRDDMNDFMDVSDHGTRDVQHRESECMARNDLERDLNLKYSELYKVAIESTAKAESNVERLESSIETLYRENEMMRQMLGLGEVYLQQAEPCPAMRGGTNNSTVTVVTDIADSDDKSLCFTRNHIALAADDCKLGDHYLEPSSFSDDDMCSVSSDASVKTLV